MPTNIKKWTVKDYTWLLRKLFLIHMKGSVVQEAVTDNIPDETALIGAATLQQQEKEDIYTLKTYGSNDNKQTAGNEIEYKRHQKCPFDPYVLFSSQNEGTKVI